MITSLIKLRTCWLFESRNYLEFNEQIVSRWQCSREWDVSLFLYIIILDWYWERREKEREKGENEMRDKIRLLLNCFKSHLIIMKKLSRNLPQFQSRRNA